jgi:6-phosphogluconolactonase/glucosamine-6-phosphate isomerase/deaminase
VSGVAGGPGDGAATEPAVIVLPDAAGVSWAAAERIADTLAAAVAARGIAHIAMTGGSTPVPIYRHLASAAMRDRVPWERIHIWFGDDRYVPRDHPLSNVLPVDQVLLEGAAFTGQSGSGSSGIDVEVGQTPAIPLPLSHLHPFPCGIAIGEARGPDWCAAAYAEEIDTSVPADADGWPIFDLVLVGIGPDGHLLSVFPGSEALTSRARALAIPAPTHVEPHVERVTLNPAILETARGVLAIVHGAGKAQIVGTIFGSTVDPARWPAQLARRGSATWLLDAAAATNLPAAASPATTSPAPSDS